MHDNRIAVGELDSLDRGRQIDLPAVRQRGKRLQMTARQPAVWTKRWRLKRVHFSRDDSKMQTIRSFIAIPLESEVSRGATKLIQRLRHDGDAIRWVPTDNLHLTLKFLGEVDNVEIPEICTAMRRVCEGFEPFNLSFDGIGGFPDLARLRVIHVAVDDASGALVRLVSELESQLAELGFKPEPRDYRPHLTLGRTRSGSRGVNAEVIERIRQEEHVRLGDMRVESIQLIGSFLEKRGPSYQTMDTIDLREPL